MIPARHRFLLGHGQVGTKVCIYRAGADFALSFSRVAGQILARRLLGQESVTVDPQLRIVNLDPEFRFTAEDTVYVCGSHKATRRFAREMS